MDNRLNFAQQYLHLLSTKFISTKNIVWTDESMISCREARNSQNDGRWMRKGAQFDEEWVTETRQNEEKVHVFVALHHKIRIVGPFYCEDFSTNPRRTLDSEPYIRMLSESVIPD